MNGDELTELVELPYDAESVLQELIENHPGLISETADSPGSTGRLLLVEREAGIEDAENATNRWSLDHLFLDSDGVPTLVEVKRSTDSRIRREVVGQMLDYAANASSFWRVERIRAAFESLHADPDGVLKLEFGFDDPEQYWEAVSANLQSARLRLVFVADTIPSELRRIVEFLNGQMTRSDVIAVEVKQFGVAGSPATTFVPTVIGRTEAAKDVKRSSGGGNPRWTEEQFLTKWLQFEDEPLGKRIVALYTGACALGADPSWGKAAAWPSVTLRLGARTDTPLSVSLYLEGLAINFDFTRDAGRGASEMQRLAELARNLSGVAPYIVGLEDVNWGMHRSMKWSDVLSTDAELDAWLEFLSEASSPSGET